MSRARPGLCALTPRVAPKRETVFLDGNSLTPETLVELSTGILRVELTDEAWEGVRRARKMIERILKSGQTVYGAYRVAGPPARRPHTTRRHQHGLWELCQGQDPR